ncbi:MAG: HK97 gp10 family phage protein [Candidatus Paceibacterota bacterium]|jgi:hypothetical protein
MIHITINLSRNGAFARAPATVKAIISDEVKSWALETAIKARQRAPIITGNLKRSIAAVPKSEGATVAARASYAKYVEPPPLGVYMVRKMKRTQYLYNSAMERATIMVKNIERRCGGI